MGLKKLSIIGPGYMPIPPTGWGAVEILIWDYYETLTKKGIEVQIVNTPNQEEIINQVNSFNPDFVHLQYDDHWPVLFYLKQPRAATNHYGYLDNIPKHFKMYSDPIINGFVQSGANMFCLSENIKYTYRALGVSDELLFVTHNGARKDLIKFRETSLFPYKSIYLARICERKQQHLYQSINCIDFIGNVDPNSHDFNKGFDLKKSNYIGSWSKQNLYDQITNYSNLVLLSDGEADPLVTKEALMAGLGLVVAERASANLDKMPFIDIIPSSKMNDIPYITEVIKKNQEVSNQMRNEIREYATDKFDYNNVVDRYIKTIESII